MVAIAVAVLTSYYGTNTCFRLFRFFSFVVKLVKHVKMEEELNIDAKLILIQLVEQYPLIYDKTLRDYKDNKKKQEAWEEIATRISDIAKKM